MSKQRIIIVGGGFGGACDPPLGLYLVEQGEVEIIRPHPQHPDGSATSVLGPGSLFGEKSLVNHEPRVSSVRARSQVRVLVVARSVLARSFPSQRSLCHALARKLNPRARDLSTMG